MANQRIFQVEGLNTNGQAVGGMATLEFDASYADVIASTPDGAYGVEDLDRAGLRCAVSLDCTDVTKAADILEAAVGNTTFSGRESGASTWHDYTVPGIVWTGANLSFNKNADARLRVDGLIRFAAGTTELEDVLAVTGGNVTGPTITYPARLYRPHTASFDPDGVNPAITPLHTESLSMSLNARVLEDYSDTDIGHTAVDRADWNALQLTYVHRDAKVETPGEISAKIIKELRGVLSVILLGRGGAANKTLTIDNVLWTGSRHAHGADYSEYTLTGQASWRKTDGTQLTLTGVNRLFSFA